jgi:hypothetical protein
MRQKDALDNPQMSTEQDRCDLNMTEILLNHTMIGGGFLANQDAETADAGWRLEQRLDNFNDLVLLNESHIDSIFPGGEVSPMRLVITESCVKEDKAKLKEPPLKTKPRRESVVDKSPYLTKTRPSQVEVTGKPMLQAADVLKTGGGMIL